MQPDLVVLGKGIGNGEPAAAVVGRADLIEALSYGEGSDTFSGNPRASAAVCAVLDVFEEEQIVERCRVAATQVHERLQAWCTKYGFVKAVRGEGLVYGVEMENAEVANRCVLEAYNGTGAAGVHFLGPLAEKVLRVSPPLVITNSEIDEGFDLLDTVWARI